jgi:hypothetical protein
MKRSVLLAVAALFVLATELPASAVNPTPTPVQTNPKIDEFDPSATTSYVAWVQNSASKPQHYDVRFRPRSGGSSTRVNATGTQGSHVGPIWGTESIVYQQYTRSTSDIFIYNLATKHRTKLGRKVNTGAWEYWPAASAKYVLFLRITRKGRLMLLYNRASGSVSRIASARTKCGSCLEPEWVGQHHAIYRVCSAKTFACNVKVLTIGGGTKTVPGKQNPYSRYGAAMDESTGDVYYVSTNVYCGLFDEIDRWNISGASAPTTIYDMSEGIDGNRVTLAPDLTTPGDVDLYFGEDDCLKSNSDTYMIPSVNTL